ncbi:MAG: TrkA family potassium uptake protein [Candidatus Micrarchaeota archaeon]
MKLERMIILGAGHVGLNVLRALEKAGLKTVVIDKDSKVCESIASSTEALVINNDFTNPDVLDELELSERDCVFAVCGSEEAVFLAGTYAKHSGAGKVVALVKNPAHAAVLKKIGIGAVVPEIVVAQQLANEVATPTIYKLFSPESGLDLFEATVSRRTNGKTVEEIERDKDFKVIAVYDGKEFALSAPKKQLNEDDRLVLIGKGKHKKID